MRTHTDVVYVKVEHEGFTAWGEATLPPYLKETQQSVIGCVNAFADQANGLGFEECFEVLHQDNPKDNTVACAAIDIALWNLKALQAGTTIRQLLQLPEKHNALNTYTIGVCPPDEMQGKVREGIAAGFEMFKLKLNGENDEEVVSTFKRLSNKPFAVDVNQGWKTIEEALEKIAWLKKADCVLVEQPFPISMDSSMTQLKEQSLLPLYADESCQNLEDLIRLKDNYHGINIKLMKCGGITPALGMIDEARKTGLKILIGCMSESSVGCNAAAQLAGLADYTDLDGPWLISNDPFTGLELREGSVLPTILKKR